MNPQPSLIEKTALVTGGSIGIGKATALDFAQKGASVIVSDVLDEEGEKTVKMIRYSGGKAMYVHCDVSSEDQVRDMVDKAVAEFGRLDFAFNNAGIEGDKAPTADSTRKNWDKVIGVNLTGVWQCMKYEIAAMLKTGGGSIVNCSSIAGLVGFQPLPAYVASKHGVVGLTRAAALEYAKQNIRVNVVCPGVIHTSMVDRFTGGDPDVFKQMEQMQPIGRMGKPEEIAGAVTWLCLPEAGFVTGEEITIDGGYTAM